MPSKKSKPDFNGPCKTEWSFKTVAVEEKISEQILAPELCFIKEFCLVTRRYNFLTYPSQFEITQRK
jgi:hypothetical protein